MVGVGVGVGEVNGGRAIVRGLWPLLAAVGSRWSSLVVASSHWPLLGT